MKPAYAYLRVSGKAQIDGDGFDRQLAAITRYAASAGFEVTQVFRELGVSGTSEGMDRPAWVDMVTRIMESGKETILVERLDRLARDIIVQEHIIADLKHRGIIIVSVAEPDLCTDDPSRRLMRVIMGAIADYDRCMIVAKMAAAKKRMRDRGERCEGQKPYGTHAGESATLARIFALRQAGQTLDAIAKLLNADGVKPRRGRKWYASSVRSVLIPDRRVIA